MYCDFPERYLEGSGTLGFVSPVVAIIAALAFLVVLLYKRVNLGIVLNATALFLALLAVDWVEIPRVVYETSVDLLTVSVVLATFGIMLLSQLYKETGVVNNLSESIGRLINNPKIVLSVLPAIIGLLPVAGGALMSAPLVDLEAEKLKLTPEKKAYVNLWFRHTVFPVYPLSPPIITAALLTGVAIPLIILRQIPVVVAMVIIGFIIGFWKVPKPKNDKQTTRKEGRTSDFKEFLKSFSPILTTIVATIVLDSIGLGLAQYGFDVVIAVFVGLIVLISISGVKLRVFAKPFKTWGIYGITLAAYGAFLLRNTMDKAGISGIFSPLVAGGGVDVILLLTFVPGVFGLLTGSPAGGVAVGVSILSGIGGFTLPFAPKVAALVYISAYLGYTIAPTHLCFTFTADYFKCTLGKMYRYVIPSFLVTFPIALLVYFLF
jgi:integral membrane protein (TIGR00529 family)